MAYRHGNRKQISLFPAAIEDYVPMDAPVRAYDVMVSALDIVELGIEYDPGKVGNSTYDPMAMLKLLVYGYSYGIRSSRKLERAVHYNVSFMWLTGGLKPDHKTISEFRRKNKSALKKVLRQCARLCIKLDLIEGNTLFVDGSKMRASASINNSWTQERCQNQLKKIDKRIEKILLECDSVDNAEHDSASLVNLNEQLQDQDALKTRVHDILAELEREGKKAVNTTDSDCVRINGRQGSHAGYNAQSVVDSKHGLIVQSDVVSANNDMGEFYNQITDANETLGENCQVACGDAGYANYDEMKKVEQAKIKVVVPSHKQAGHKKPKAFDKEKFRYDSQSDIYICPAGAELTRRGVVHDGKISYMTSRRTCRNCKYFGECTTSQNGRKVTRYANEAFREKMARQYEQADSQAVYRLRKSKVELPFGHIKRNLGAGHFLLRGLAGVRAEMSLLSSCFNMARMISIIGVPNLLAKLTS
ncbi:MAG TPA: IS1182 family transposase [Phycisphaerae bacterium]|nr:IS1182 family transposase [Phycisphaerae bacterium]